MKKERLLLDLDHTLPHIVLLNLIALGLPARIQDSLNRTSVTTVKILIQKLKKYDGESTINTVPTSETHGPKVKSHVATENPKKSVSSERKPCSICEKTNRSNRFYPESLCWFRDKKSGPIKTVNNVELESELNSLITDQKTSIITTDQ